MLNIFQTKEWARFKCQTGYEKYYEIDEIFVLQKKLPLGRTMLYSPLVNKFQIPNDKLQININKIKQIAKENKTIFYRLELDIPLDSDQLVNQLTNNRFAKSFEEMQPEHTLILDIAKSDADILAQMKPKGRYNIKIAEKYGVIVKKTRDVSDFYRLYEQTAKRQRITYRDKNYFQKLLDNLEPKGYAELFIAYGDKSQIASAKSQTNSKSENSNNNETIGQSGNEELDSSPMPHKDKSETVLASAIISFYKNRATYLFGASSDEMRNVMAPYKLHWEIVKEAKRRGCAEYDFFGIAPNDNLKHPWAGVTRFKKQFGGREVNLMGSWDLILRPMEYRVFKIAEKIRRH